MALGASSQSAMGSGSSDGSGCWFATSVRRTRLTAGTSPVRASPSTMRSTSGSPTVRIWSRNESSYFTSAPYDRVGVTATARGRQPRRSAGLLDLLEVELAELAVAGPLEVDVDALRADVAAARQAADVRHAERQLSEPS